jgi:hypothetical protein
MEIKCRCQNCQNDLEPRHTGACPHCGKTAGKICDGVALVSIGIKATVSKSKTSTFFEFYNKSIKAMTAMIMIDIVIFILGTIVGILVGNILISSIVSLVLIIGFDIFFRRKEKNIVREITKYQ